MSNNHSDASIVVFWDIVDCKIHDGLNVNDVSNNIEKALKDCGYNGSVSIKAYGETDDFKDQFINAGINPMHVAGDTNHRVRSITIDMYAWVINHPDSVVMFVFGDISRDVGFIKELAELGLRNFRILLCQPPSATGLLFIPTTKVWRWDSLALGVPSISETERIKLVDVNNPRSYYVNQPESWKYGLDSDDEKGQEEALEPEEENLELEYMSEIQRLKDVVQERDAKMVEMEKKQEELESAYKSIREELNEMKEIMKAKFPELFKR